MNLRYINYDARGTRMRWKSASAQVNPCSHHSFWNHKLHSPPFNIPCKLHAQTDSSCVDPVQFQQWLRRMSQGSSDHFLSLPRHSWDDTWGLRRSSSWYTINAQPCAGKMWNVPSQENRVFTIWELAPDSNCKTLKTDTRNRSLSRLFILDLSERNS